MEDYRWYSLSPGWRPDNGIYVDKRNRLLYWPNSMPICYVLNANAVEELSKKDTRGAFFVAFLLPFFLTILGIGKHMHGRSPFWYTNVVREYFSLFGAIIVVMGVVGWMVLRLGKILRKRRVGNIVKKCPSETRNRPKTECIKFLQIVNAEFKGDSVLLDARKSKNQICILAVFGIVVILAWNFHSFKLGDKAVFLLFLCFLIRLFFRALRLQQVGLLISEIKLAPKDTVVL